MRSKCKMSMRLFKLGMNLKTVSLKKTKKFQRKPSISLAKAPFARA